MRLEHCTGGTAVAATGARAKKGGSPLWGLQQQAGLLGEQAGCGPEQYILLGVLPRVLQQLPQQLRNEGQGQRGVEQPGGEHPLHQLRIDGSTPGPGDLSSHNQCRCRTRGLLAA